MLNKKIINKVFDNNLGIDNLHDSILFKIERKNKMNKYLKYSLVPIGLIIISCSILILNKKDNILNNKPVVEEDNIEIYVNEQEYFNSLDIDGKRVDLALLGQNNMSAEYELVKNIKLPEDLTEKQEFVIYTRDFNSNNMEYNILHDYVCIYYNRDNSKMINIAFSKVGMPLRCYLYEENGKESNINDIKLTIYGSDKSYIVIFNYKDFNFDIETRNISLEELVELLKSIIK